MTDFATFVGVSAALICTPGPGTALTIGNSLSAGRRCGLMTACGVVLGQAVWAAAAAFGVGTVLRDSQAAVTVLGSLGAAYLCFAGARSLRTALSRAPAGPAATVVAAGAAQRTALRDGLVSNLGNPKMIVVATGILPQFAAGHEHPVPWTLLLGLTFCAITMTWLTLCTTLAWSARRLLSRPAAHRALVGVPGALLVLLGVRLLVDLH